MSGTYRIRDLAKIYTMVGEYEAALDEIEYLLAIPSLLTVPRLRLDPDFDPLREIPRFQKILQAHPVNGL
jgi:hypothetical protein